MTLRRPIAYATLAVVLPAMPGCVLFEIRDELATANGSLREVVEIRKEIHESLAEIDASLDSVHEDLQALKETNTRIGDVNESLDRLDSIDGSLKNLDEHLASLRKSIESIDSAIPFISIAGDDEEEPPSGSEPGAEGGEPKTKTGGVAGADSSSPN